MTDHRNFNLRRSARSAAIVAGVLFGGAIILLWSWNGFAVDILQAPALRFKQALALELLLLLAAVAPALTMRLLGTRRHQQTHP